MTQPRMPRSFVEESDKQRIESAEAMEKKALKYYAMQADDWPLSFYGPTYENPEPVRPAMFARAVHIAVALDDAHECTTDNIERLSFTPLGSEPYRQWRIEVVFRRSGPWSGKEWYVSEGRLLEVWERCATGPA